MKGNWIWYPGDFEIHHGLLQNFQREERGYDWPAYWNIDDCSRNVHFYKKVVLSEEESFVVYGRGQGYVSVNGKKYRLNKPIICSAGEAEIDVFIGNLSGLPCIYADGKTIFTDSSWTVNRMYGEMVPAGICDLYQDKNQDPNQIYFNKNHVLPYEVREVNNGVLFDFHKEINGTVIFHKNTVFPVMLCYGESDVEALDVDNCYYRQLVKNADETIRKRAFRYIFVPNHKEKNISLEAVHEYLHKEVRGKFNSSDHLLNDIWKTAEDTFLVCCGLLIPEGAKRDRWLWAGDAYQSFFINQYLQADASLNQRMIIAMRGNDPIKQHINTIVDYSLLWIISIRNQYMMDGDLVFLSFIYPKMKSMMDYCIAQTDPSGFIIERPGDWIFIDWADIDKEGPVCAEQMLLLEAEKCVDYCGKELHVTDDDYEIKAESLLHNINNYFWDEEKHAYIDSFVSHKRNVTRHANILAVLFDIANENQRCDICQNVLFNEQIPEITTPYFKFFELDAMGKLGREDVLLEIMRSYWGGMLKRGAVTFWEQFDPSAEGSDQYAMYGDPYGKSLCHAWGASPNYLIARYLCGVAPVKPGYEKFKIEPLGIRCLDEFHAVVPVGRGNLAIDWSDGTLTVCSDVEGGTLILKKQEYPVPANEVLQIKEEQFRSGN